MPVDPQAFVQKRFDITATVIYVGVAKRGAADSAAVWTIQRITFAAGLQTVSEWTNEELVAWTDRATATYR